MNRRCLLLSLVALLSSCANVGTYGLDTEWIGTYSVESTRRVEAPGSLTGWHSVSTGAKLETATTRISAKVGTRFGAAYRLTGPSPGQPVQLRVIWHYPSGGLVAPGKSPAAGISWTQTCRTGSFCFAGHKFTEEWERVPGAWLLEVWVGQTRLLRQSFEVVPSAASQETPDS